MNGTLSGLVSITGGCAVIEPWAAVVIGFAAGVLYLCTSKLLVRMRIDDVVDAVPVHCSSGELLSFRMHSTLSIRAS